MDKCPLCRGLARTARQAEWTFVDCLHCSHYWITETGVDCLRDQPLSAEEVANIAVFNWEWPGCELNEINVRKMGQVPLRDEHHRFFQCFLAALYNTFQQQPFVLEFHDPMWLGVSGSPSPEALRGFVMQSGRDTYLPNLADHGTYVETVLSDAAMSLLQLPIARGPGIRAAFNLPAFRRQVA